MGRLCWIAVAALVAVSSAAGAQQSRRVAAPEERPPLQVVRPAPLSRAQLVSRLKLPPAVGIDAARLRAPALTPGTVLTPTRLSSEHAWLFLGNFTLHHTEDPDVSDIRMGAPSNWQLKFHGMGIAYAVDCMLTDVRGDIDYSINMVPLEGQPRWIDSRAQIVDSHIVITVPAARSGYMVSVAMAPADPQIWKAKLHSCQIVEIG